ncbi:MAG TPA: VOC family protein [Rhizomicrobium sp.]|nr:VOC family protein [Rhizomicrobium sp.]
MSITRFSHVTIYCANLETSLEFYRDVLEMSISDRKLPKGYPRAAIGCFADGEWCLHFFEATAEQRAQFETLPTPRTGVLMHVSLRAEGYVATRKRLDARGISVREFTVGDRHLVQFLDPDGLEIELTFSPTELPSGPISWVAP